MTPSKHSSARPFLADGRIRSQLCRRVLEAMASRVGRAVTTEELAEAVWPGRRMTYARQELTRCARIINRAVDGELVKQIRRGNLTAAYELDLRLLRPGLYRLERTYRVDEQTGLRRWVRWTPDEDAILRKYAGTMPLARLAQLVVDRVGHALRTYEGVRVRLRTLGVSWRYTGLSAVQVAHLFGLDSSHLPARWITPGYLRATRRETLEPEAMAARNRWFLITEADIEVFIREYPWQYDYRLMRRGHRLSSLAETIYRQDPWLYVDEASRTFGVDRSQIWRYLREGRLPNAKRMHTGRGKLNGAWRIPASDLHALGFELARHPSSNQHPKRRRKKVAA